MLKLRALIAVLLLVAAGAGPICLAQTPDTGVPGTVVQPGPVAPPTFQPRPLEQAPTGWAAALGIGLCVCLSLCLFLVAFGPASNLLLSYQRGTVAGASGTVLLILSAGAEICLLWIIVRWLWAIIR